MYHSEALCFLQHIEPPPFTLLNCYFKKRNQVYLKAKKLVNGGKQLKMLLAVAKLHRHQLMSDD